MDTTDKKKLGDAPEGILAGNPASPGLTPGSPSGSLADTAVKKSRRGFLKFLGLTPLSVIAINLIPERKWEGTSVPRTAAFNPWLELERSEARVRQASINSQIDRIAKALGNSKSKFVRTLENGRVTVRIAAIDG